MKRCTSKHPLYGFRCVHERGHYGEHFHSFYMRSWDDEPTATADQATADGPMQSPFTRRALSAQLPTKVTR